MRVRRVVVGGERAVLAEGKGKGEGEGVVLEGWVGGVEGIGMAAACV